jgi:RNA polymerase sigma factor (sigma-70 family)
MQLSSENSPTEYIELAIISKEEEILVRRNLIRVLKKLPQRQREAIYLRFYHNLPYETIASMMDMNYQSILNLVQRALNSLRKEFAGGPTPK